MDPDIWYVGETNRYWKPPELARNLRCAGLFDTITTQYFLSLEGLGRHWNGVRTYAYMGMGNARITSEDARERDSFDAVGKIFADRAWMLAAQAADRFDREYGDAQGSATGNGLRFLKAGLMWEALNSPRSRCMDEPAAQAIADKLRARLARPYLGNPRPASPRLKAEWLPEQKYGYLYQPGSYRYLVCSALAQAIGELRFGGLPRPFDGPLRPNWEKDYGILHISPGDAALRRRYARAVFDTFDAGKVHLKSKEYVEGLSYRASQNLARAHLQENLPDRALLEEAMKEPNLRCAELPSMAPIFDGVVATAAVDDEVPVVEIPGWPGRNEGYKRRAASFRPLFCGALLYRAYNDNAPKEFWYAPPSNTSKPRREGDWRKPFDPYDPAEQSEREAVKRAIYALYASAQIDDDAKKTASDPKSVFASNFEGLMIAAIGLISDRHAVISFNEPSARCSDLPEIQPIAQAALKRLGRLDKGELKLR